MVAARDPDPRTGSLGGGGSGSRAVRGQWARCSRAADRVTGEGERMGGVKGLERRKEAGGRRLVLDLVL